MTAICYVQGADWVKYWQGKVDAMLPPIVYTGPDRRVTLTDRRQGHDRRWFGVEGRRYRLVDRRRG